MKKFKLTDIEIVNLKKAFTPHLMVNPETGDEVEVNTLEEHQAYTEQGFQQFGNGGTMGYGNMNHPKGKTNPKKGELTPAAKATGQFLEQLPDHLLLEATEVEKDEHLKMVNGDILKVHGDSHENGGTSVNLEEGTQIISDNLEIGKRLSKQLSKDFNIKLDAKTTYAEALSKYNKIVGYDKLNKEQEELFELLEKQEKISDSNTKKTNLDYLNKKLLNIETKKSMLDAERTEKFDKLFEEQEKSKGKEKGEVKKEIIEEAVESEFEYGGTKLSQKEVMMLAERNGISMEKAMFWLGGTKKKYVDAGEVERRKLLERQNILEGRANLGVGNDLTITPEEVDSSLPQTITTVDGRTVVTLDKNPVNSQVEELTNTGGFKPPYDAKDSYTSVGIKNLNTYLRSHGLDALPLDASKEEIKNAVSSMQSTIGENDPTLIANYMLKVSHQPNVKLQEKLKSLGYDKTQEDLLRAVKDGKISESDLVNGFKDGKWHYRSIKKAREYMSPDDYNKLMTEKKDEFIKSGDKMFLPDPENPGKYVEYYTDEVKTEEVQPQDPITNPDGGQNIVDSAKPILKKGPKGYFFPDESVLPPNPLEPHLMVNNRRQRIDPIKVGIEDTLTQINNQTNNANKQLESLPPALRAAASANTAISAHGAVASAVKAQTDVNAVNQEKAELFNIQQADTEDFLAGQNRRNFETLQLRAKANTDKDLRDYFDKNREIALNRINTQQTLNMFETMNPDYSLDMFGNAINFDPSYYNQVQKRDVPGTI